MDHGFYTAALEVACGDALTVTDPALRAKRDKMYREDPRWRKHFLIGYRISRARTIPRQNLRSSCLRNSGQSAPRPEKARSG